MPNIAMPSTQPPLLHRELFDTLAQDYKDGRSVWRQTSVEVYHEQLCAVPPACLRNYDYEWDNGWNTPVALLVVGEAYTTNSKGELVFPILCHIGKGTKAEGYWAIYGTILNLRGGTLPEIPEWNHTPIL